MNVSEALVNRKSVRAFKDQKVATDLIKQILTSAGHAPSGVNTQPWITHILSGGAKNSLQTRLEGAFRDGQKASMEYQYYPLEWAEPFRSRRKDCGLKMYSALEITREDKQKQQDQWAANYRAFDAPVMLIFSLDKILQTGSYLDFGMFLQSLMLAATEQGLATCPQAALAEQPEIVRSELKLSEDSIIVCGMSMGYEDTNAAVNNYRTEREPLENWATFLD